MNSLADFIKFKLLQLPVLASEHGRDVDDLIVYVHWLMAVLFVGWMAYFLYAIFRFRKTRNPKADYAGVTSHASSYIEVAVAVVEAVLLVSAVAFWSKAVDKFPPEKDSTVIRVTAEQFTWNSRYPGPDGVFGKQDVKFVNATNAFGIDYTDPHAKDDVVPPLKEIHVPVNKPVIFHLTSKDVIHCFKVIPLRVTQDVIPGMSLPVHFIPTKEGQYQITCAQLCGNGHSTMNGYFTVDSQENFNKWLAAKSKSVGAASFE